MSQDEMQSLTIGNWRVAHPLRYLQRVGYPGARFRSVFRNATPIDFAFPALCKAQF